MDGKLSQIDIYRSCINKYEDLDELDADALEEIEFTLYGMLHHAPNEENDLTAISEQVPSTNDKEIPTSSNLLANIRSKSVDKDPVEVIQKSGEKLSEKLDNKLTTTIQKSKTKLGLKSTNHLKHTSSSPKAKSRKQPLKKSLFSEYLVVERSSSSRLHGKKDSDEVLTLSDEEDSKYESINKAWKLRKLTENPRMKVRPTNFIAAEESESDDSVVVLDSGLDLADEQIFSTSDSSDSDIEIIQQSSKIVTDAELKLNISGSTKMVTFAERQTNCPKAAEYKEHCSEKWTSDMVRFYHEEEANLDCNAIVKSFPKNAKWHIDNDDRFGPSLQRNRYFGSGPKARCANCQQWDHSTRMCREPRKQISCSVCGKLGHKQIACRNKVCLGCGRTSNIFVECCPDCRRERKSSCTICQDKHVTENCPDLWRRFHSTITGATPTPTDTSLKPERSLFCCNCAERGHMVHECPVKRWSKYPAVSQAVFSYENPVEFLQNLSGVVAIDDDIGPSEYNLPQERGGSQKYYVSLDRAANETAMNSAKRTVLKEIKHVDINWRKQKKKGRMIIEFTGNGDTKAAKLKFKKLVNFQTTGKNKANKSEVPNERNLGEGRGMENSPSKKNSTCINAVTIQYENPGNHHAKFKHRTIRVKLTDKTKRHVGKCFSKLEKKHKVKISSSYTGSTWEVNMEKQVGGNPANAVSSLVRLLHDFARPVGV